MRISRKKRPEKPLIPLYRRNEFIRVPEVRVIDAEGNNIGVLPIATAVAKAREVEMDLVEINPKAEPPVAQILDFSHFKYQKEKELKKQKLNSHVSDTKGIRLSIRIGDHDLDIRRMQSQNFLERGDKVKAEIILRGRENAKPNIAFAVHDKFFALLNSHLPVRYEQEPTKQANKITSIIARKT